MPHSADFDHKNNTYSDGIAEQWKDVINDDEDLLIEIALYVSND